MSAPLPLPRRVEDRSCLSCRHSATEGEWYCVKCQMRRTKQATEEEAKAAGYGKVITEPVKASGTTENQQYGGDRPLAQGRVGPFEGRSIYPNAEIDGDYPLGLKTSLSPCPYVGEPIGDLTITSRPLKAASEKDTLWS